MISPRKRIWGWWFFDWASQPVNTLLMTFIFGPYFAEVARGYFMGTGMEEEAAKAAAQSYWAFGLTITSLVIMVLAPILGAIADSTGRRLVWVWFFSLVYVVAAWALWYVAPGGEIGTLRWALFFFGLAFLSMEFATIFTNALMPSLGDHDDLGAISGSGFAFGYLGGLIALFVMLLLFAEGASSGRTLIGLDPVLGLDAEAREGTRAVGPFSAVWYLVFMIPFFLWVKEPKMPRGQLHIGAALGSLVELLRSLKFRKSLLAYLTSSLFYRDALNALYGFGGVYASNVLDWSITAIGIFGIVTLITGAIFAWLGGRADDRFGPRRVITTAVIMLALAAVGVLMISRDHVFGLLVDESSSLPDIAFYLMGGVIGAAGGTLQAASRTMLVRQAREGAIAEAFGLYALAGKATAFLAPLSISAITMLTGSQPLGMIPLMVLFLLSLILLAFVKPKGEETA